MADGCVYQPKYGQPIVNLTVCEEDIAHLRTFQSFVGAEQHRLHRGESKGAVWNVLTLTSSTIASDLDRLGIVPRKSLDAKAGPAVTNSRDFWRGVVDGDGYLGVFGRGRAKTIGRNGLQYGRAIGLYGSEHLLGQFRAFLVRNRIPVQANVRPTPGRHFRIVLKGAVADATVKLLYADAKVALPRKRKAAETAFHV